MLITILPHLTHMDESSNLQNHQHQPGGMVASISIRGKTYHQTVPIVKPLPYMGCRNEPKRSSMVHSQFEAVNEKVEALMIRVIRHGYQVPSDFMWNQRLQMVSVLTYLLYGPVDDPCRRWIAQYSDCVSLSDVLVRCTDGS